MISFVDGMTMVAVVELFMMLNNEVMLQTNAS